MTEVTVGFGNTALPLAILALLAAVLPYMLSPRDTRSHARVFVGIGLTALLMMVVSGVVFALIDTRDLPNGGATGVMIIAWFYLRSAFRAAAIWGPVLAIVWLSLAQRVEKRRGEDMARGEEQSKTFHDPI